MRPGPTLPSTTRSRPFRGSTPSSRRAEPDGIDASFRALRRQSRGARTKPATAPQRSGEPRPMRVGLAAPVSGPTATLSPSEGR